jgi:hypothetical protein
VLIGPCIPELDQIDRLADVIMTHPEFSGGVSSQREPRTVVKPHEEANKAVEG